MTRLRNAALLLGASLLVIGAVADDAIDEEVGAPGPILTVAIDSIIHPVAAEVIAGALVEADVIDAQALIIELSTPGGLMTSTREISTAMLEASMPVVVYVSPQGSQAASAGFFLLMSADIAAMAPGTNTGAAHPVGGQGEDIEGVMAEKVEQDAAANIRSLAGQHGRDEELAEAAVIESRSFTAKEALEANLIDLIADDIDDLVAALDGRAVTKGDDEVILRTAQARMVAVEMTLFQRLRSSIAHPNIAYLLMTFGGLGLYFELSNPGAIFPGVIGAICLILAFYALSVLPVNYAGIALMILAAILFLLEIKVPSFGLLTAGGVACLVLGSVLLFDSPDPAVRVSLQLIFGVALFTTAVVVTLLTLILRVHRSHVATGQEGLLHEHGVARTQIDPGGKVSVHGEIWNAISESPIAVGEEIEILEVDGMTLKVQLSGTA
ncbi:MAG: nodulation protein NfeD [Acidobacteriota bacterium]|nr:nodulation protein NfeD [Acidobacteriota bacterium]